MTDDHTEPPRLYSGQAKVRFCRLMAAEHWQDLADLFEVPLHDSRRFTQGNEPRELWELMEGRGRLHELDRHLGDLGLDHVVKEMHEAQSAVLRPPQARQQDLNTLFFDLDPLRHELINSSDASGPVLCFAIPHRDAVIGDKVLEWLPYCFPRIECKPKRSLGPLVGNINAVVGWLTQFRDEMASVDVGVHVDALRSTEEVLADFVERVHDTFSDCPHRLVLILAVIPDVPTSPSVIRLPPPAFRTLDVGNWAQRILVERGWPLMLARAWVEDIEEYAAEAEHELDPSRTYQVMESSIASLLSNAADFRRQLEQRTRRAQPTPDR